MADSKQNPADKPDRSLSEISHLFLSSVRDRHTNGAARPQRTPPSSAKQRPQTPVDLTGDEFARILDGAGPQDAGTASSRRSDDKQPTQIPPVTAVIASHLNGQQRRRVREYAAHLCKSGERIGLIELDATELRLSCFELGSGTAPDNEDNGSCDSLDGRRMTEALEEMSWDVDRWLLNLPNPRLPEARALLQSIRNWTVLATCDHDGVVSCYRSMKGLADLHEHELAGGHQDDSPTLSLALLDSHDEMQSIRVFRKLANVCRQFLHWPLESEAPVVAAGSVVEHQVLDCKSIRDKSPIGAPPSSSSGPQWQIVSDFVSRAKQSATPAPTRPAQLGRPTIEGKQQAPAPVSSGVAISSGPALEVQTRQTSFAHDVSESGAVEIGAGEIGAGDDEANDVIDLPSGSDSAAAIVSATLRGDSGLVELPVKAPMLDDASLAITRDRRLVLLAVAQQGLNDLRAIGEAWRWMNENRALIAMAVPQLSIDPHQLPHLRLLIDRADLSAGTLQPLLQSPNITVRTYRRLRWGSKTGLLLEAA